MDFLATSLRGGVATLVGVKRVVKRAMLMNIYHLKERFFSLYDTIVEVLDCERRRQLQWRRESCVNSFCHKGGLLDDMGRTDPAIYDFGDGSNASTAEPMD
eukprot:symbB.v1.2.038617.t1/scaffold6085.1/size21054/2